MPYDIHAARRELTPTGTLRVGLNLANFLLINPGTGQTKPEGIVPDLAQELAQELGVSLQFVPYAAPGPLGDAVDQGAWDVAFLADEPARAATIAFSPAYLEIQASYLVPAVSPFTHVDEVDRAGVRIASMDGGAYTLYLQRNLSQAQLVLTRTIDDSCTAFVDQGLEALAGLRPRLISDQAKVPGSVLLPGGFTAVQQAIGTSRRHQAAPAYLADFSERAKAQGRVQAAIDRHRILGVNVAPARA